MPISFMIRNTGRARQVVRVLVRHGFGHFLDRLHLEQIPGIGRVVVRFRRGHARLGTVERLRMALEELGPTFIKLGQLLASRPDLVGPENAAGLADLQDRVPPFPGEEALRIIAESFPGEDPAFFAAIEPEPAAAASIAQVHYARLADGTPVAIKVRRPGIREQVETDINILHTLAHLAEKYIPEAAAWEPVTIAREFARSIRKEMDFTLEAVNVDRIAAAFAGDGRVLIPRVYWERTTSEVLTVERIPIVLPIDKPAALRAAGIDPRVVGRNLMDVTLKQILDDGFFHGDPHPGNLTVLPDGRIGIMDFGLTGQIDRELKQSIGSILFALIDLDLDRLVDEYLRLSDFGDDDIDMPALKRDLRDFLQPYYGRSLKRLPIGEIISRSINIVIRYHLRVPPDLLMMGKAMLTVDGIVRRLDPELNPLEVLKPHVARLAKERYGPGGILRGLKEAVTSYTTLAGGLPRQVGQILSKVVRGRLQIDFRHTNLEGLIREMDRSANRVSFAIVTSAIIIGSALIIHADRGYRLLGFPVLGLVGFFAAGVLGLWLVVAILRSGRL